MSEDRDERELVTTPEVIRASHDCAKVTRWAASDWLQAAHLWWSAGMPLDALVENASKGMGPGTVATMVDLANHYAVPRPLRLEETP